MKKTDLKALRDKIDAIDTRLIKLLNDRTKLALKIGAFKNRTGREIYAPDREDAVLRRLVARNPGPIGEESLRAIYREIMSSALALEKPLVIAYLGPEATYSHMASVRKFGASLAYEPLPSIPDVFAEVAKGRADYGVVPIENSTEGAVTHTYDMFVDSDLKVCSQILLPIRHNLMSAGARRRIKKLYSISQVFAQCRNWIQMNLPQVELVEVSSSTRAAEKYGLKIHDAKIQDSSENVTRFLVIGRSCPGRTGVDKTSIMFSAKDKVGALHDSLAAFKRHRINLTKIESRPSKKKAWEYYFFVDFLGHCDDPKVKKALEALSRHTMFMKVLGSYPNVRG